MATTLKQPVPVGDGYGDVVFNVDYPGDGTAHLFCVRADPRIRISDALLHEIAEAGGSPEVALTMDGRPVSGPAWPIFLLGAVLTFNCANRRLIYRITGWEPDWLGSDSGSYLAEWPD